MIDFSQRTALFVVFLALGLYINRRYFNTGPRSVSGYYLPSFIIALAYSLIIGLSFMMFIELISILFFGKFL